MKLMKVRLPNSWKIFWLLIGLSLITFFLSFHFQKNQAKILVHQHISITPVTSIIIPPVLEPTVVDQKIAPTGSVIINTPVPTQTNNNGNTNTTSSGNSQNKQLQVTVSINRGSNFSLSMSAGSNQCDVLNEALREGKISSLTMKYDGTLNTYGVYVINGLGKDNQVWWTYTVNGSNPPMGCSYVKVNNNDSISWVYIGSN